MSSATQSVPERVDPALIPQRKVHTGATMPAVGLVTFGDELVTVARVAEAVKGEATIGFRHFDCASVYGNESAVGASLEAIVQGGIKREERSEERRVGKESRSRW